MGLSKKTASSKLLRRAILPMLLVSSLALGCAPEKGPAPNELPSQTEVSLPEPRFSSQISLEQTLLERRSIREYTGEPLSLDEVSQLLWAAQGITEPSRGFRTAPSAGALYPLETYVVAGDVEGLPPGAYRYMPAAHQLRKVVDGDVRAGLAAAGLAQSCIREGAISIVLTAIYERTTPRYGERGIRYVHMEAGHAAQNVCLQAVALNLGAVVIGAFHDESVRQVLALPRDEQPLYIIPVGRPQ